MDDHSRYQIYGSQVYQDDVRVRKNCDSANYRNKTEYAGNHSLGFGNILQRDKCSYDSQVSGIGNLLYRADYDGNRTPYREDERLHEHKDRSERITPVLGRNYHENSSIEVYGNNCSSYSHSSVSYEHNHVSSTSFHGLLALGDAARYDDTKRYTTSANSNQTATDINGDNQVPVDITRYSGKVALYDVQTTNGKHNVPTSIYQGVNWTSSTDVNHRVNQRYYYSDTASVTNSKNHSNGTLQYGSGRSSSDNLKFDGTVYGQHHEPGQETRHGHCTTWSYDQQKSLSMPIKIDGVTSRKRKLDDEKPGATSKQEINNNDIPSTPKVDKRALYSKYRVVKRKDQSQATNESTKVKPFLWRFRLGDKTIVDVNEQDGLPKVTKRAKVISTLTPVKENEAEATISNIEFITLDNMKVVRRKLEMVQLVRQEDERQERLKVEAEVKAKVKANAKVRMRTNKRHKDRRRGHV